MPASVPLRKIWPLMVALTTVVALTTTGLTACAPKPTAEASPSSAADEPGAMHTQADDVAGRDSAAALEAAMAASPSAVDVMVQSASASALTNSSASASPAHAAH